jgi:hypothetical protein
MIGTNLNTYSSLKYKIPNINYDIKIIKLFGLESNFIVIVKKINS